MNFKSKKRILLIFPLIITLLVIALYFRNFKEKELINEGNIIINKVEDFKNEKSRLPTSLTEIEISEKKRVQFIMKKLIVQTI